SAMPRTSSARRRTLATTAGGRSSNESRVANATSRSASVTAARSARGGDGAAVARAHRADRAHRTAVGVGDRQLLDQPRVDELLHERLALLARRRQQVRAPAGDEVA